MHRRAILATVALALAASAGCPPPPGGDVRGSLSYEARFPSFQGGAISLDTVETLPAVGMLAVVVDGDGTVIGMDQLDTKGKFSVDVNAPLNGDETVVFSTLWAPSLDASKVDLAVLVPPVGGEGTYDPGPATASPWAWNAPVPDGGDVGELTVTEAQGSGAMYVFLFMIAAQEAVLKDLCNGDESCLVSLGVHWAPGVAWSCGACYSRQVGQQVANGPALDQSIFLAGGWDSSSAWGFTVSLHEFGHYVAANYSRDDSPGGPHGFGQLIAPPFAWSEGWASFFAVSTMSRWIGDAFPVYWDIQGGNTIWINYDDFTYFQGDLVRPDPAAGMAQDLDESYVVSMLWHLWDGKDVPETGQKDGTALGTDRVLRAVGSDRFVNYTRGAEGADFVDFVDSVLCADGSLKGSVTKTVTDVLGFPYDGEPGCP